MGFFVAKAPNGQGPKYVKLLYKTTSLEIVLLGYKIGVAWFGRLSETICIHDFSF